MFKISVEHGRTSIAQILWLLSIALVSYVAMTVALLSWLSMGTNTPTWEKVAAGLGTFVLMGVCCGAGIVAAHMFCREWQFRRGSR